MPHFNYAARDQRGVLQNGELEAGSEQDVVARLQHRGLIVTSVSLKGGEGARGSKSSPGFKRMRRRLHAGIKVDDQVLLCQQLATLVEAGVPLLRSLEVVTQQVESRQLMESLEQVRRDVQGGSTFREALVKHPKAFSPLWLNLVETGEASGHLAESLRQLARHFEAAQHLQNEARTALTYPAFLIVVAILVLGLFVYWLIPKFAGMFESMEIELPLITRFVLAVSNGAKRYWVLVIGGFFGSSYLLTQYLSTEAGMWTRDRLMLKVPMFSTLFTYVQLAEFSRGLSTLLESGVPLLSGLQILENSATNKLYGRAISTIKERVKEGKTMAEPMEATGMFPPIAVQMVQIGEEVGELSSMTGRIAKYYEERVDTFISRMTRLFEPIAIVVMGGLVLIIVLSIFLPIFKLATSGPPS
ncbi:MAG TPA: type II secretion system F family protein [Gemmatimonadaceae bacterium]